MTPTTTTHRTDTAMTTTTRPVPADTMIELWDDTDDMPIYGGTVTDAHKSIIPGTYVGMIVTDCRTVTVTVTDTDSSAVFRY